MHLYYFTLIIQDSLWCKLITYNIVNTVSIHQHITEMMEYVFDQNNFELVSCISCS